ncbi:histone-lysine N-methyltransferase [Ascochyta rabiei]|uniref:Histone-lysine N-methyltransferase, H3 lysine-79 specific n=1 Tax=Didymella rabiei TaxID=5454 RepID=A0A163A488_DIDRA|nr:histone-lysine N-methyltransferase [Ascochyta rabiei]
MFEPSKPKIKTRTVTILKKVAAPPPPRTPAPSAKPANGRTTAPPAANRYQLSSTSSAPRPRHPGQGARESPAVSSIRKRKVTPSTPPLWASSDESSADEDADRLAVGGSSKRLKSCSMEPAAANRQLEPDLNRRLRIRRDSETMACANASEGKGNGLEGKGNGSEGKETGASGKDNGASRQENGASGKDNETSGKENGASGKDNETSGKDNGASGKENGASVRGNAAVKENGAPRENGADKNDRSRRGSLTHGLMMTRGDFAKNYKPAWPGGGKIPTLELQYPSPLPPETFEARVPFDSSEYNPLGDIQFTIEEIITHYLPADLSASLSSDVTGPVRKLKRAAASGTFADYQLELIRFNKLVRSKLADGTIPAKMDAMHAIPLSLVKHMTQQTYARIVSPLSHKLRKVKGKETTYGELMPVFVHKIFAQTGLNSSHVFVDLGSGVGNVVLQSALQTGAESWGIEIMDLAASLATRQATELKARARLWNLNIGALHLLKGNFLETPAIDAVLARADVVLVNNKVFGEELNNALLQKFLDLKLGCKVVSLESFGGGLSKGVRSEQSIAGLFDEERFESGTDCVSWAGESVEYFIAEKAR